MENTEMWLYNSSPYNNECTLCIFPIDYQFWLQGWQNFVPNSNHLCHLISCGCISVFNKSLRETCTDTSLCAHENILGCLLVYCGRWSNKHRALVSAFFRGLIYGATNSLERGWSAIDRSCSILPGSEFSTVVKLTRLVPASWFLFPQVWVLALLVESGKTFQYLFPRLWGTGESHKCSSKVRCVS